MPSGSLLTLPLVVQTQKRILTSAVARPMPLLAPVISATLSFIVDAHVIGSRRSPRDYCPALFTTCLSGFEVLAAKFESPP